jgi:hypothetical protein
MNFDNISKIFFSKSNYSAGLVPFCKCSEESHRCETGRLIRFLKKSNDECHCFYAAKLFYLLKKRNPKNFEFQKGIKFNHNCSLVILPLASNRKPEISG